LPSKYCPTHFYLFTGRAFPLLVCWSPDGDLTIFPSSLLSIQCCGSNTVLSKLCTASSRSSQIPRATQSMRRKYCRCTSGYLHRPSLRYTASAASAASSPSPPFPILHHSSANVCTPWALAFELRLAPGQRVPNSAHRHFQSLKRISVFFCYTPAQRRGISRTVPFLWCLSPTYSLADAAYRPRNAEPALHHFLPASLASLAESPSTSSGSTGCLHCQILLLLSRHPAFHGRSQSLHIASPNHPAACGT
jgi:hypothetical protein